MNKNRNLQEKHWGLI